LKTHLLKRVRAFAGRAFATIKNRFTLHTHFMCMNPNVIAFDTGHGRTPILQAEGISTCGRPGRRTQYLAISNSEIVASIHEGILVANGRSVGEARRP